MHSRRPIVAALIVVGVLAFASPALAHIDPDPTEAQAGSELSVGFTVEHGCQGSPTVQLDMRLPDGATDPSPEPPTGWIGTVDANVITFQGGPLRDDQELTFRVRMTLPATPDATIYFPFVQRCEVGEIRWIDIPTGDSGAELDEPAPAMQLFGPVATTVPAPPTTTPATTASTTSTTTTSPTNTTNTTTASTQPTTAATGEPSAPSTSFVDPDTAVTVVTADDGSTDTGSSGTVVFIGVLLALAVVAGIATLQARRGRP